MSIVSMDIPVCDACGQPWFPEDPEVRKDIRAVDAARRLKGGYAKGIRCGKCKSFAWDARYQEELKKQARAVHSGPRTKRAQKVVAANEESRNAAGIVANSASELKGPRTIPLPQSTEVQDATEGKSEQVNRPAATRPGAVQLTQTEIARQMGISRQRVSQLQRRADGLCVLCPRKAHPGRARCSKHLKADSKRKKKTSQRAKTGKPILD